MESSNKEEKQQEGQPAQPEPAAKAGATLQSQNSVSDAKRAAEKMQVVLKQLVIQLKQGCKKQFCFNRMCRKNLFQPVTTFFSNDREMVKFAIQTLQIKQNSLDELICSETPTFNRADLESASNEALQTLIENCPAFCCSFQDQSAGEVDASDGDGGEQAKPSLQLDQKMQSEVSAFDDNEEMKEEEDRIAQVQAEELSKERQSVLKVRKEMRQKFEPLAIDMVAVRLFMTKVKSTLTDEQSFWESIEIMVEIILHEYETSEYDPITQLMCIRGLFILMLNEQFSDYMGQAVSEKILAMVLEIMGDALTDGDMQDVTNLSEQTPAVQFLSTLPTKLLHEYVMQLQNLLTVNIIQGSQVNYNLFTSCIRVLDLLQWLNTTFKDVADQIEKKEFHNDAVNNNLDLRAFMNSWADRTINAVAQDMPFVHSETFNPCEYHWLLTPHIKTCMLQRYNRYEWQRHIDFFLMRSFWDASIRQRLQNTQRFLLDISRESMLNDSLQKIVHVKLIEDQDPLKLPITIRFAGEPGQDEGGVRKEYFQLVVKELLSPDYGMFKYNEDVRLYYFNGKTMEPNIYFELIGTLMGIAVYNNTFIDLPFPMACFKVLIDEEPTIDDLRQWEPETAKSLELMLAWDEDKMGKLEEVMCRTFTVDVESFGEITQEELKTDGNNIQVTKLNVTEFVRLYIDFQFRKQCESQLASFKKGFTRMLDMRTIKSLFDYEEVETLICGQRELNFEELRDNCIYANGFTPTSEMMTWLWEIILVEWTDDNRRKWLAFSTGSDRAPVNGLKSLKFYIIQDGEDDKRLPSSHTCFNQLLIPKYSTKEILRERLQTAVENSTGFGMI